MASFNFTEALNDAQDIINNNHPLTNDERNSFVQDGFMLPSTFSADGNGLPYTKVPSWKKTQFKRNIIKWLVPEFGIVTMYINPASIQYNHKKLIQKDRTKGGYTLQYWGEELDTLNISGTTGSSGIEGINMLYEIYRAEQYAADAIDLSLSASNAATDLANRGLQSIGLGTRASGILSGILGMDSPNANNLASKNVITLAQLAFSVEMFYNGIVYRGYFTDMTVTERADNFLLEYRMEFVVTQRRGYRMNYFPWSRTPANGASSYTTPLSADPMNVSPSM